MFEQLGLTPDALEVYELMLESPQSRVEEIRPRSSLDASAFDDALNLLRELQLVIPRWTDGPLHGVEYAVHPTLGLPILAQRRRSEAAALISGIEQAEADAKLFAESFAHSLAGDQHAYVEILRGKERAHSRMQQLTPAESLLAFIPAEFTEVAGPTEESPDKAALDRGVEFRVLYRQAYINDRVAREYSQWLSDNGGEARFAPNVPMRIVILDRRSVVMPLDVDDHDAGALVYHGTSITRLATFFFEYVWDNAIPHPDLQPASGGHDEELSGQEREFLRLLRRGATDAQVARDLGISLRTVRRIASNLSRRTGASGRFELGVRAAQNGWVR